MLATWLARAGSATGTALITRSYGPPSGTRVEYSKVGCPATSTSLTASTSGASARRKGRIANASRSSWAARVPGLLLMMTAPFGGPAHDAAAITRPTARQSIGFIGASHLQPHHAWKNCTRCVAEYALLG